MDFTKGFVLVDHRYLIHKMKISEITKEREYLSNHVLRERFRTRVIGCTIN